MPSAIIRTDRTTADHLRELGYEVLEAADGGHIGGHIAEMVRLTADKVRHRAAPVPGGRPVPHVQVPLWPVRLPMQNFVVLAIGLPFVPAEAVKLTLAAAAAPYFWRGLR